MIDPQQRRSTDLPRFTPPANLSWAQFFSLDGDDYIDDDEHNFSGPGIQLSRQDYPEDEERSDEDSIALYDDNYGL